MKILIHSFLIILLLVNCKRKQVNEVELCFNFCNANSSSHFYELYRATVSTRTYEYNKEKGLYYPKYYKIEYYDSLSNDYVLFPIVEYPGNESSISNAYKDLDNECKTFLQKEFGSDDSLVYYGYFNLINKILSEFKSIKVPDDYYYENVLQTKGNPRLGRFIQFKLKEKVNCYYIQDVSKIESDYKKEIFDKTIMVNKEWCFTPSLGVD